MRWLGSFVGEEQVIRKFAFLLIKANGEWRWLEFVYVHQTWHGSSWHNDWFEDQENIMIANVVIGKPLVSPESLLALDQEDWKHIEKEQTLFTETRYLPAIMKEAGIVSSTNEVRRNNQKYNITLGKPDCMMIKWGKKFLFVIVGEQNEK